MCALAVLAMWLPTARGDIGTGGGLSLLDDDASFIARSTNGTTNYLDDFTSPAAWLSEPASPESESVRPPMESAAWDDGTQLPEPVTDFTQSDSHPSDREELDEFVADNWSPGAWSWQWMPAGLIYRSYLAGVHEPRMALVAFYESGDRTLWDATLGGRVGLLRCGDCDPLFPQGYQLDFYGAAVARLDVEHHQDLDSTDYVFGFPVTYGVGNWQFKLSYAHLSSHLGDELALRDPDTLDERVNYVRDAIVFGTSCYPHPVWRQYAEVGWAFHNSGGAQPWDAQFGSELSQPGPTGPGGSPFLAVNGRMREEHDFGGDLSVQAGWLRRGEFGQTLRFGAHYYNGKSSQFQFYDNFEEQMGIGLWYDF
jgi:hypothetical protein